MGVNACEDRVRVAVAEASSALSEALLAAIELHPGLDGAGIAGSVDGLVDLLQAGSTDSLLLGVDPYDPHAAVLISRLTREFPDLRIVLVGMREGSHHDRQARRVGADGYVLADSPPELIGAAARGGL